MFLKVFYPVLLFSALRDVGIGIPLGDTFTALVGSIAFALPAILGMVEFLKAAFSMQGKAVTWMSFGVGIVFGTSIFLAFLFPAWGVYVAGGVFILSSGLVASGFYKFVNARFPKAEWVEAEE